MRLKKLAVLGNICFWLTLVFQFEKWARNLQQDILNTIVMIGLLAVVINLLWIIVYFTYKIKLQSAVTETGEPGKNNQAVPLLFTWFNILSFVSQLIFIFFKLL